jgi:hypothetical protein
VYNLSAQQITYPFFDEPKIGLVGNSREAAPALPVLRNLAHGRVLTAFRKSVLLLSQPPSPTDERRGWLGQQQHLERRERNESNKEMMAGAGAAEGGGEVGEQNSREENGLEEEEEWKEKEKRERREKERRGATGGAKERGKGELTESEFMGMTRRQGCHVEEGLTDSSLYTTLLTSWTLHRLREREEGVKRKNGEKSRSHGRSKDRGEGG